LFVVGYELWVDLLPSFFIFPPTTNNSNWQFLQGHNGDISLVSFLDQLFFVDEEGFFCFNS